MAYNRIISISHFQTIKSLAVFCSMAISYTYLHLAYAHSLANVLRCPIEHKNRPDTNLSFQKVFLLAHRFSAIVFRDKYLT